MRDHGTRVDSICDFLFMEPKQALGEEHARILSRLTVRDRSGIQEALFSQKNSSAESRSADETSTLPRVELGLTFSLLDQSAAQFRAQFQLLEDIAEHGHQNSWDGEAFRFEITTLWFSLSRFLEPPEIAILKDAIASATSTIRHLRFEDSFRLLATSDRLSVYGQLLRTNVCYSGATSRLCKHSDSAMY